MYQLSGLFMRYSKKRCSCNQISLFMFKTSKELSPIVLFISLIILFAAVRQSEIAVDDCQIRNGIYFYHGEPVSGKVKKLTKNGRLAARFNFLNGVKHGEQIIYCFDGRTKYATITYRLGHKKKTVYKHPVKKQTKH